MPPIEPGPRTFPVPARPSLLDDLRRAIRLRHYSPRTELAYVGWTRRFVQFHGMRHPRELREADITRFLSHLALRGSSASTQNQALNAVAFLYGSVLGIPLPQLPDIVRARRPRCLPTVLSPGEVADLLAQLRGVEWLMASLLYGGGLRLMECVELRVKDVHFDRGELMVREGKGDKDRVTMLPRALRAPLAEHVTHRRRLHERDLANGRGTVALPGNLRAKYPRAPFEWGWQWVFPATRFYVDEVTREHRRHHLHESVLQRAVKTAARAAGITRPAGCHTLRHHADSRIMPRVCPADAVCSGPDDVLSLVRSA